MGRKKHSLSSIIHNVSTDSFEKFNWRHKISNLVEYNNYLVNNPFYNSDHFSVDLSIDFATIIIAPYHHSLNDTIYKLYLLGISRYVLKNGYGNCVISHNNAHYTVFFQIITVNNFFKCCLLKIHDPDLQILHHVHNLFSGAYLISQVEFTADCLAKEHDALLFLMNHLMLLKWPGALLRLNYATIYGNDIRNNKFKGVRLYEKQLKANLVVRLEIVYKRSYFRKNKINSLLQLNNLSADSVFSYVTFRMLKTKTIINKFKKLLQAIHGDNLAAIDANFQKFKQEFYPELIGGNTRAMAYLSKALGKGIYAQTVPFDAIFRAKIAGRTFI